MLPSKVIFKGTCDKEPGESGKIEVVTGTGMLVWPDNVKYEGQLVKSIPHG
jgi:hypothetical protein